MERVPEIPNTNWNAPKMEKEKISRLCTHFSYLYTFNMCIIKS